MSKIEIRGIRGPFRDRHPSRGSMEENAEMGGVVLETRIKAQEWPF